MNTPPTPAPAPVAGDPPALATVSLITGILGLSTAFCSTLSLPLQLAAIVTGHIALIQLRKAPTQAGKKMATWGLACGYLGIVLIIASIVALVVVGNQVKASIAASQSHANAATMTNNAPASPNP